MSKAVISEKLRRDMDAQFKGSRTLEGGNKTPYYKVDSDGEMHAFRVLPGEFGESKELWFLGVAQHWIKKESNRIPLYCPKMEESPCPFCDKLEEYREEEKALKDAMKTREVKDDKAKYKKYEAELKLIGKILSYVAPRSSYMINVLDRDDGIVKVFSAPKSVFTKIMSYFSSDGPEIFGVAQGHDFRIKKKKKGRAVEYTLELVPKESPVKPTEAAVQDTLDKRHDLEGLIKYAETDKLEDAVEEGVQAIINGTDLGEDDPEPEADAVAHAHHRDNGKEKETPAAEDNIPMEHAGDKEREASPASENVDLSSTRRKPTALLSRMNRLKDDE